MGIERQLGCPPNRPAGEGQTRISSKRRRGLAMEKEIDATHDLQSGKQNGILGVVMVVQVDF
jgi:hypothetical protein